MTTHHTIDEALTSLIYTTKIIRLKEKMSSDFIQHDKELAFMLENVGDAAVQKLIDEIVSRFGEDIFDEYGR
jgi:hypothetical protein